MFLFCNCNKHGNNNNNNNNCFIIIFIYNNNNSNEKCTLIIQHLLLNLKLIQQVSQILSYITILHL